MKKIRLKTMLPGIKPSTSEMENQMRKNINAVAKAAALMTSRKPPRRPCGESRDEALFPVQS